jgi:hypothetical protein
MASEASNTEVLGYMVCLLWNWLSLTPAALKNPVFAIVLATQVMLQQILSDSLLVFAPGLMDVVQAPTPPSISWYKSLPTYVSKCWAVYLLVLEKKGFRPNIYVGSGTDSRGGVASRFYQYDTKASLPVYVERALKDGYTITHKGLLCWCPVPAAAIRFQVRTVILALEAMFSFVFWAMKSRTKDYGMPKLCPWNIEDLHYDGLCSHSALGDSIQGQKDGLTLEQIVAKQAELEQLRKAKYEELIAVGNPMRRAANRAAKRFVCDACDEIFEMNNELEKHKTSQKHLDKVASVVKVLKHPDFKEWTTNNIAKKKYHCKLCDYSFATDTKLQRHKKTKKHIDKAAAAAKSMQSSS